MRAPSAAELLAIWERGQGAPLYDQALLLLAAACPEESSDRLEQMSIGSRDERLLTLREWIFGPTMTGVSACPSCGERAEITVRTDDVRTAAPGPTNDVHDLELGEYQVDFRLPGTVDLRLVDGSGSSESIRAALIGRCILKAHCHGEEVAPDQLPAPVIEAVVGRMGEQDPQAEMHLDLTCPACSRRWQALFDIASFFWGEIQVWAQRMLRDVHILASAYGWREEDILAMHPLRRQSYLRMVCA